MASVNVLIKTWLVLASFITNICLLNIAVILRFSLSALIISELGGLNRDTLDTIVTMSWSAFLLQAMLATISNSTADAFCYVVALLSAIFHLYVGIMGITSVFKLPVLAYGAVLVASMGLAISGACRKENDYHRVSMETI